MNQLLRTLLYEWKDRALPRVVPRDVHVDFSQLQELRQSIVVTGFRRVGKTYLLFEAIEKLLETHTREEVVYINFEDERVVSPTTDLLSDLVPEIQAVYGKKPLYLFVDELQLIPRWSKWVRRMLDSESIQLCITGSSSKMGSSELPTELRGRAWEIRVAPLTFQEFLRFKHESIDDKKIDFSKDEMARFRFLFDEYATFGGLPAVVLTNKDHKQELLQSYFQTVVQKDVAERYNIKNDVVLKTLLQLLFNSSYITISKLANSLKSMNIPVGKSTIQHYLSYIESSYFIQELFFYHQSVKNQLLYPRKVYFVDTGFISALSTKFSKNMGRIFENIVYSVLSRKYETVHYYKDEKDHEVDFVIFEDAQVIALYQVCVDISDEETLQREVRALVSIGKTLRCEKLHLVTLEKPDILYVPGNITVISVVELFQKMKY